MPAQADWNQSPVELRTRPPVTGSPILARSRALARIGANPASALFLVQAPIGFGKTSLLIDLHEKSDADARAWLSAAEYERPSDFLGELALSAGLAANSGLDGFAELAASAASRFTFLIDDCSAASGAQIISALAQLVEATRGRARFFLAGRNLPGPEAHSALTLRGLVTHIGWRDLAYSHDELALAVGAGPSPSSLAALLDFTGGWPALARLASLALEDRSRESADAVLEHFASAESDDLEGYLLGDVLASLPSSIAGTVMLSGFVDRMERDLPEAFGLPLPSGGSDYRTLKESSPLVVPDNERIAILPALEAVAGNAFEREPAADRAGKHRTAAQWYLRHGRIVEAVTHHAAAGDYAEAADIIRQAGSMRIFLRFGLPVLNLLLSRLPAETVQHSSALKLCQAVVCYKQGHVDTARYIIENVKMAICPGGKEQDVTDDEIFHIDTLVGVCEDRACEADIEKAVREKLIEIGPRDFWLAGWLSNHRAIANIILGNFDEAERQALLSLNYYKTYSETYAIIFIHLHLATIAMDWGKPRSGLASVLKAKKEIAEAYPDDASLRAIADTVHAQIAFALGETESAGELTDSATDRVLYGEAWVDLLERLFETRINVAIARNDPRKALETIDLAEQTASRRGLARLGIFTSVMRTEVLTRFELIEAAIENEADHAAIVEGRWEFGRMHDCGGANVTWREWYHALRASARLTWQRGRRDEAVVLLERLCEQARRHNAGSHSARARALLFSYRWQLKQPEQAFDCFQLAVAQATPQQFIAPFSGEGAAMAVAVRGIMRKFGVSAFSKATLEFTNSVLKAHLPEEIPLGDRDGSRRITILLTDHEREILQHLSRGLPNKTIALEVGKTEATVKYHLQRIYRKLGVESRGMAIVLAKELSIH